MNKNLELNTFISHYNDLLEENKCLGIQVDEYKKELDRAIGELLMLISVMESYLNYPNMPVFLKPAPGFVWPNLYPEGYPSSMCYIDDDKLTEWSEVYEHVLDYNESLKTLETE